MNTKPKRIILRSWLVGFPLWFAFDLFMEAIVFEALGLNGTTKNDWFFILWWIVLLLWTLVGGRKVYRLFSS